MIRLIFAFLFGLIIGLMLKNEVNLNFAFKTFLPLLLFSVGISLSNIDLRKTITKNKKLVLFPIFSLLGSCLSAIVFSLATGSGFKEILLSATAMGFYSLPAIMVSTQYSVTSGSILLITNILREAITILVAPLSIKLFGKQSIIATGGATTMDVNLATIKELAGSEYIPLAVVNGLVLTLLVPFLISLILQFNF